MSADNRRQTNVMSNWRWVMCAMLFFATTVNYLDRQVLSLTYNDFIAPEFHWSDATYGNITGWFSLLYACAMLFIGRCVDRLGTKWGYFCAIGVWSFGACIHALCGTGTQLWLGIDGKQGLIEATGNIALAVSTVSMWMFITARFILAVGESGNFPAANKVTAEYFPKKDRAFATSIYNAGAQVGALIAPLSIPLIAQAFGWEMAFIVIGALGFIWMIVWYFLYDKPESCRYVNQAELEYIHSDSDNGVPAADVKASEEKPISFWKCLTFRQTWAFAAGKFFSDGVWWFFLFWMPVYISSVYGYTTDTPQSRWGLFTVYLICMASILGGYLPTIFVEKKGMEPYAGRMRAMLIFAFFPLLALLAQPLGSYSFWWPVIIVGIAGAAHQSWSANLFSTVSDMFPRSAVATVTGIGGMAGGISCFIFNKCSGLLFDYAGSHDISFLGFTGKPAGYFIVFCVCGVCYLIGWFVMKALVPKYSPVKVD